jgi:uncharacterized membrane protein YbhN (UPF0104 family)
MRTLIGLVILAGFAALVEYVYGWAALLRPWGLVPRGALALALALTFASYLLRAGRVRDYFRAETGGRFLSCLRLTLQHNLFNNLLPARSGELSFPVLMQRYFGVPPLRSMTVLVWFRALDLHVLVSLALAAGLLPPGRAGWPALLLALWLPAPWLLYRLSGWLRGSVLAGSQSRPARLLRALLEALPRDGAAFWRDWGWTCGIWIVKLGAFAWVLTLFLPMPATAAVWGAVAGDLTSILPIHGVAGAGTYEAGVVAGLLPSGVEAQPALQAAVNLHIFLLGATLLGGVLGFVIGGRARAPRAAESE